MIDRASKLRPRKCAVCHNLFFPVRPMQSVCSPVCALKAAKKKREREEKRAAVASRRMAREKLEAIKTVPQLLKEAQREFNRFIRLRDKGKTCICCGRPLATGALTGGEYDAGHYRSVGSAPQLRFNEDNCHAQRKDCNQWGAGRAVDYRIGLIARIGLERVEALESDNKPHKWSREELREVITMYKQKSKALQVTL